MSLCLFDQSTAPDLWHYLRASFDGGRPIVMYGMGNGADKILAVLDRYHISVADFFASDGFVRGHSFHGKTVLSYSTMREKYAGRAPIVLLSFASSRPEVLALIDRVAAECELYAPDVPVAGAELFDAAFAESHRAEIAAARALLSDDASRRVFDEVIRYKLTGRVDILRATESTPDEAFSAILPTATFRRAADLGAYTGDTIRELRTYAPALREVIAFEPDRRNRGKLEAYAASLATAGEDCRVHVVPAGAWSEDTVLTFHDSGNRNACLAGETLAGGNVMPTTTENTSGKTTPSTTEKAFGKTTPSTTEKAFGKTTPSTTENPYFGKVAEVPVRTLDAVIAEVWGNAVVDYIKYDVEGAERDALRGSRAIIARHAPSLLVSAYHRSEDIFALPLLVHELHPGYRLYLRRMAGVPAWDLNLYAVE